jgi:ferredoxin-NADP reductase
MKSERQFKTKIKSIEKITHDVLQLVTERPENYLFKPGQATEVSINKSGWQNEKRPFTFTSVPNNDYLEFTIKTYPAHHGVTHQLLQLKKGDELLLHEVFGAIEYKGAGVFIAGGAGVTPFISILRSLYITNKLDGNKLIFANKTKADIILDGELHGILGDHFINILSEEKRKEYASGVITEDFIQANRLGLNEFFYVCGPPPMMKVIESQLKHLGVSDKNVIKEKI